MSDPFLQMAWDAGYRDEEARRMADQIEETERHRQAQEEYEREMYEQWEYEREMHEQYERDMAYVEWLMGQNDEGF